LKGKFKENLANLIYNKLNKFKQSRPIKLFQARSSNRIRLQFKTSLSYQSMITWQTLWKFKHRGKSPATLSQTFLTWSI